MLNFFKRNNKIRFTPLFRAAQFDTPIVPANKYKRDWIEKQKKTYLFNKSNNSDRVTSTHKCPGLTAHFSRGFIVSAHRDINLYTHGDINEPVYESNTLEYQSTFWAQNVEKLGDVGTFSGSNLEGIQRPYPLSTPNLLFKIVTPWLIKAPTDVVFLMTPVPFANTTHLFTTVSGIFDTQITRLLQVLIWTHKHNDKTFCIKKGTPLVQLIPISRTDVYKDFEVVNNEKIFNQEIAETLTLAYLQNTTLTTDYANIRNVSDKYDELHKKEKKCPFSFLFKK